MNLIPGDPKKIGDTKIFKELQKEADKRGGVGGGGKGGGGKKG